VHFLATTLAQILALNNPHDPYDRTEKFNFHVAITDIHQFSFNLGIFLSFLSILVIAFVLHAAVCQLA